MSHLIGKEIAPLLESADFDENKSADFDENIVDDPDNFCIDGGPNRDLLFCLRHALLSGQPARVVETLVDAEANLGEAAWLGVGQRDRIALTGRQVR